MKPIDSNIFGKAALSTYLVGTGLALSAVPTQAVIGSENVSARGRSEAFDLERETPDTRVLASMSIHVGSHGQGKPCPYEYVGGGG